MGGLVGEGGGRVVMVAKGRPKVYPRLSMHITPGITKSYYLQYRNMNLHKLFASLR